jgi:hypothetical protein
VEADLSFEGAIALEFGPSVTAGVVHFVIAIPGELHGVAVAGAIDGTGDTTEGELATTLAIEADVGRFDHVRIVRRVIRHLDDAPLALHTAAANSLGKRIRSGCRPRAPA